MSTRKTTGRPAGKTARKAPKKPARRPPTPLLELAATWPFVTQKYMFGCEALLAGGRLFFIEMEEETVLRVGKERLKNALKTRGSRCWNPWKPGEPGDWVSFPPARRQITKSLADCARAAYELALTRKPAKKIRRKKPPGNRHRSIRS